MSFYRQKQFQCEVTGKSGLDYFQALESERQEARTMHSRFPDQLKAAVLKAVQWRKYNMFSPGFTCLMYRQLYTNHSEVMGRLDHLVEAVYDRFKDRYYPDESTSLLLARPFTSPLCPGCLTSAYLCRGVCRHQRREVRASIP